MSSVTREPVATWRCRAAWSAAALLLLAAAWLSPRVVPYNMDEFVHYHALGCRSAGHAFELPTIRDGCGYHDLRLPFTTTPLPLRSYLYIGSLPALPFYPFWKLVKSPVAVRLAGATCFLLSTMLAARLLRARVSALILASLLFPVFVVTFLVDEGPVGLSAALLLVALHAARRALLAEAPRAAVAWAAAAGLSLFLGLWTKLVFAWWLPLVLVFLALEVRGQGLTLPAAITQRLPALVAAAAFLAVPTALLLASTDRDGRAYVAALRQGGLSTEPDDVEAVAVRLVRYLVDGSLLAPRNLLLPGSRLDALPLAASAALIVLGVRQRARRREILAWALVAALTFAFVSASGHSRWPHHFAFPLLPLVLALAVAVEQLGGRGRLMLAALALAYWASLVARLPDAQVPLESSPDKDRLLAFVREGGLDREALQVHASWGTYYIAQLFGDPARAVVYTRRISDDPARLAQMAALATRLRRPLLLLSSRRFERLHTPVVEGVLGEPLHTWRFGSWWAVLYRPPRATERGEERGQGRDPQSLPRLPQGVD